MTPGFGSFVHIKGDLTGPTTLDAQVSQFLHANLSGLSDYRENSRTTISGDVPGTLINAEWSVGDIPFKGIIMIMVKGARVFWISAAGTVEIFDQHQADVEHVIDTFEITASSITEQIDTSAEADEILNKIGERVARIRGFSALSSLKLDFQTRQEFKSQREPPDKEILLETERLKDLCLVLDLCSESDDLSRSLLNLQGEGVLGFYEIEEDSVTLATDGEEPGPLTWLTYAHEYTHALQDQQFDLAGILRAETFDSSPSTSAAVEGDASLTESLFYDTLPLEQQNLLIRALEGEIERFSRSPKVIQAPRIIRGTFGWEHSAGPGFVFCLYLEGGFDAINKAYQDPPQSTEQILHPEKYLAQETPQPVNLPDLAATLAGWRQQDTGVLGELLTGIYLEAFLPKDKAVAAAQGWGGDRYVLYKDDQGRTLIAMRFLWDDQEEADEFFQAYLDFVTLKSAGDWELLETDENIRLWAGDELGVYLDFEGAATLVIIGPDPATVRAVSGEISEAASR